MERLYNFTQAIYNDLILKYSFSLVKLIIKKVMICLPGVNCNNILNCER